MPLPTWRAWSLLFGRTAEWHRFFDADGSFLKRWRALHSHEMRRGAFDSLISDLQASNLDRRARSSLARSSRAASRCAHVPRIASFFGAEVKRSISRRKRRGGGGGGSANYLFTELFGSADGQASRTSTVTGRPSNMSRPSWPLLPSRTVTMSGQCSERDPEPRGVVERGMPAT